MGEVAEMMLDGTLCQCCGQLVNEKGGDGYSVYCSDCEPEEDQVIQKKKFGSSEKRLRKKIRKIINENFIVNLDGNLDKDSYGNETLWTYFLKSTACDTLRSDIKEGAGTLEQLVKKSFRNHYINWKGITQRPYKKPNKKPLSIG